jgi:hypothetical protein
MVILPLTITAGSALSDPLEISSHLKIARIAMPDAWDPAPITFQISLDGTDWYDVHNADKTAEGLWSSYETGLRVVTPNSVVLLPPATGVDLGWVKIRSGTRTAPVAQSDDRTFRLMLESTA